MNENDQIEIFLRFLPFKQKEALSPNPGYPNPGISKIIPGCKKKMLGLFLEIAFVGLMYYEPLF